MSPFVCRMIALSSLLLFVVGCDGGLSNRTTAETVKFQHEAGSFNMAVTLVAPWEDYADDLTANFSLTADDALKQVIPTTGVLQELDVSQQGVSAKFGLPRITSSKTKTKKTEDGETTTMTDETLKREPGEVPDASSIPGLPDKSSAAPGSVTDKLSETVADPHLVYNTATALYQEVQLLKRYVRDAAQRWNMAPYIVRVQLGSTPYRRNLPYDVYATFSFFPKASIKNEESSTSPDSSTKAQEAIYGNTAVVLPLIVTDSLEGTLRSRTDESVRQMALSLGFIVHGIAGDIGFNKLRDELRAVIGTEVNSLLTVGSLTEGVTSVRLGAARQGSDAYVMVPRNHQVTLLVMFPKNFVSSNVKSNKVETYSLGGKVNGKQIQNVRVTAIARMVLRNSQTGVPLPIRKRSDEMKALVDVLQTYSKAKEIKNKQLTKILCRKEERANDLSGDCREFINHLIKNVFRNNYIKFRKGLLASDLPSYIPREAWLNFAKELGRREFVGSNFDLPRYETEQPPLMGQIALVVDNGKSMTATLRGGRRLIEDRLSAHLTIDGAMLLPATGVAVSNGGSAVTATFPSAIKWKLRAGENWKPANLVLCLKEGEYANSTERCANDVIGNEEIYSVRYITTAAEPAPVFTWRANPALTATGKEQLIANVDDDNMTSIEFIVEAVKKDGTTPLVDTVRITIPGANVKGHKVMDASGATIPDGATKTFKGLEVKPDALIKLDLEVLGNASETLELSGIGLKGGKAAGDSAPPLTFTLNRSATETPE